MSNIDRKHDHMPHKREQERTMIARLWNWWRKKIDDRNRKRELWSMIIRYRPASDAITLHLIRCDDDVTYIRIPTPNGRHVHLKATRLVPYGNRLMRAF